MKLKCSGEYLMSDIHLSFIFICILPDFIFLHLSHFRFRFHVLTQVSVGLKRLNHVHIVD